MKRTPVIRLTLAAVAVALAAATLAAPPVRAADPDGQGSILIEYEPPSVPTHQRTYDIVRQHHALEMFQRIFKPFRLPEGHAVS